MLHFGKYNEAYLWFETNKGFLSNDNQKENLRYKIVYCQTMVGLKRAREILPTLDRIIQKTSEENLSEEMLQAIIAKASALDVCLEYNLSLEVIDQGLKFLNKMPISKRKEFLLQKAKLLEI